MLYSHDYAMTESPSVAPRSLAGNPFANASVASGYEDWYLGPGRRADELEKRLLHKLLTKLDGVNTVLDVGCGTGHFTRWLEELGYDTVGLDSSLEMLAEARRYNANSYQIGDAQELPFAAQSFDVVALITTLEFVGDPVKALSEAVRVARHGLLLGVLNRHSLLTWKYRRSGKPLWQAARFLTPRELRALVAQVAERRLLDIRWRTTLWPLPGVTDLPLPWGGFIGAVAQLAMS